MDFYSMLLAKKLKKESSGDVTIESLVVTENGNYSETGKAYSPVIVNVPFPENGYLLESESGQVVNITDAAPLYLQECVAEVEPIQEGSGDPSPDNIRHIIGQTEVVIDDCGKNLFDASEIVEGTISTNNGDNIENSASKRTNNYIKVTGGSSYVISGLNNAIRLHQYTYDKTYIGNALQSNGNFMVNNNCEYIRIAGNAGWESNILMIRLATETDSTFEPYKGKTYTIQLGDAIYGGELDVLTGEMVVDRAIVNPVTVSSKSSSTTNDGYYLGTLNDAKAPSSISELCGIICNEFEEKSMGYLYRNDAYGVTINTNKELYIFLGKGNVTTISKANTWLSNNPLEVVYELAEPYTIQLTPQQIRLLEGNNRLSCNTGDLNIEYLGKGVN